MKYSDEEIRAQIMSAPHQPASANRGSGPSLAAFFCMLFLVSSAAALAQSTSTTWAVTIVLPPRVVAGQQATLAVLGTDGRIAPNVVVDLGGNLHVTTDKTGRAVFNVPNSGTVLFAKASGNSAVALIDPQPQRTVPSASAVTVSVPPVVALHDQFAICGAGTSGDADANLVKINGEFAPILAASPECAVVLPPRDASPGPATLSLNNPEAQPVAPPVAATFTLVALNFAPPSPPLEQGKKSILAVNVRGSDQPLRVVVQNETPGILAFRRGDLQELRTTGGAQNSASVEVQAISSGSFSFHARVLPQPDPAIALRYLQAAIAIAPQEVQSDVKLLANRLAHHPNEAEKIRAQLQQMIIDTIPSDFHTLLDAAHSAL
jgi:hypothetical protein